MHTQKSPSASNLLHCQSALEVYLTVLRYDDNNNKLTNDNNKCNK